MKAVIGPVVAAALLVAATLPLRAQRHFPDDDRLRQMAAPLLPAGAGIGMVIGVLEADGTRRVVSIGAPYDGRTVFEIGSVTKVFTGILLAEMAARGELRLDEPVADLLPDSVAVPSRAGRPITLVDLATHTSGLPRMPADFGGTGHANPYAAYTPSRLYGFLGAHELARDVGAQLEYSNLGVGLLGHALALRARMPYEELLAARVLVPLDLSSTQVVRDDSLKLRLAPAHGTRGRPTVSWSGWEGSAFTAAGGLSSTADDMLAFLAANLSPPGGPLGRALRLSHETHFERDETARVGLNWMIQDLFDGTILWHNGRTRGYQSFVGFHPAHRVGVVVFTNSRAPIDMMGWHLLEPRFPLNTAARVLAFIGLVLALVGLVAAGVAVAWRRTGTPGPRRAALLTFVAGIAWLAATLMASSSWITVANVRPATALAVAAGISLAAVIGLSRMGRRLAAGLPLAVLVAAQAVRLPVEMIMHRTFAHGSFPPVLNYRGYTLDTVLGILAVAVALLAASRRVGHSTIQVWNWLGLLLLLNLLLLSLQNVWVGLSAFIWLPTALLPFALLGHILVFRKLHLDPTQKCPP